MTISHSIVLVAPPHGEEQIVDAKYTRPCEGVGTQTTSWHGAIIKKKQLNGVGQYATGQRPWLISGAVIVGRIFSPVQCNVLVEIDSAAIATTGSNPGELTIAAVLLKSQK
jgi:hypothetical protein